MLADVRFDFNSAFEELTYISQRILKRDFSILIPRVS